MNPLPRNNNLNKFSSKRPPLRNRLQISHPDVQDISPKQFWESFETGGLPDVAVIVGNPSRDRIDDISEPLYFNSFSFSNSV